MLARLLMATVMIHGLTLPVLAQFLEPSSAARERAAGAQPAARTEAHAWIGLHIRQVPPDVASSLGIGNTEGAFVNDASSGSPAANAGIEAGDVITALNDQHIKDPRGLAAEIAKLAPGTPLSFTILHHGQQKTVTLTAADKPQTVDELPAAPPPVLLPVDPAAPASGQSDAQQKRAQLQWLSTCYQRSSDFCGENWLSAQRNCGPGCFSADFISQKIQECSVKKWRICDSNFNHSFGYWPNERDRGEIGWAGIYK